MASRSLIKKGNGLMFLALGVFALLAGTFFVVNGNFDLNAGAHRATSRRGILRKDPNHLLPCNQQIKADYVLQTGGSSSDLTVLHECTPVVANPSDVESKVGQSVQLDGVDFAGRFFTTNVHIVPDSGNLPTPNGSNASPSVYYYKTPRTLNPPDANPVAPVGTSSYTGPATRNRN